MNSVDTFADVKLRHVFHDEELQGRRLELLTPSERDRYDNFKSETRKMSFVLGRAAARELAAHFLDVSEEEIRFSIDESGAIDLVGFEGFLSLSHSGDRAVAALAPVPVGVDLEMLTPRSEDIYKFVLKTEEYHLLTNPVFTPNDTVLLCWSVKEAILKGLRTGLRLSPQKIMLEPDFGGGTGTAIVEDGSEWDVLFELLDGYFLSIARIRSPGHGQT